MGGSPRSCGRVRSKGEARAALRGNGEGDDGSAGEDARYAGMVLGFGYSASVFQISIVVFWRMIVLSEEESE